MSEENKVEETGLVETETLNEKKKIDWNEVWEKFKQGLIITGTFLWKWTKIISIFLWKWTRIISRFIIKYVVIAAIWLYGFVKKNYKERWFQVGSGLAVVTIVGIIVVSNLSGASSFSERTTNFDTVLTFSEKETTIKAKDLDIELNFPAEFTESEMDLDIKPVTMSGPGFEADSFMFDVNLEGQHMLPGVVEITIAYDKDLIPRGVDASRYVSAMYYNGSYWEYVNYSVNDRSGEVTIKTDHFSTFGIFLGDDHPENKEVESIIPTEDVSQIDTSTIDGVALAWAEINRYAGIADKAGTFAEGVLELTPEAAKSVNFIKGTSALSTFTGKLGEYGKSVYYFGLAKSIYEGKTDQAVFAFLKDFGEALIGSFSPTVKKFGGAAMFAIDYSLNEFIKTAFDGEAADWEKAYNNYYDDSQLLGKSAYGWRDWVLAIYDAYPPEDYMDSSIPYPDFINAKVDDAIDEYLELIWQSDHMANAITEAGYIGVTSLGVPSEQLKDQLEANYKKQLYSERIMPSYVSINKVLEARAELARENEIKELAEELTKERWIYFESPEKGTYKITDGNEVFLKGELDEKAIFTLYDYIEFGSTNLYVEVKIGKETTTVALPSHFPNGTIFEVNVNNGHPSSESEEDTTDETDPSDPTDTNPPTEPEDNDMTREDAMAEYDLNLDYMYESAQSIVAAAYEEVADTYNSYQFEYQSTTGTTDHFKAIIDGETFLVDVIYDESYGEDNFGYAYETIYNMRYKHHQVHLDKDFNLISVYTFDGTEGAEVFFWGNQLDSYVYSTTNMVYQVSYRDNGSMEFEEVRIYNSDGTTTIYDIRYWNEGIVDELYIDGVLTYKDEQR